ncbi:3-deoxy-D-manno-octulosonic acid transferase [Rhodovulum sp. 12E13]|uniref:3-deoxy-D-manno-octulosonic acid transferase n=1 Tax=Rhodovulum sp. 12E13 TaxID=2203891 RepID=UPI000E130EAD|nr:glycosyltransferase N-terminal domain-containing protein [Rhodovulum sp. 12E13]RDC71128.1 3-deoxy-D-manno-octulosonic acid transferase [Rhodovulum sp. 12E13]
MIGAYRLALSLAAPVLLALWLVRLARGRETWADLRERLGRGEPGATGALWVHGASVGELAAARPLIEALQAKAPGLRVVVTCNTVTGRRAARDWRLSGIDARLAPLDYRRAVAAFLRRLRPAALVVIENELWPNRLSLVHAGGMPVALVAARLSSRSAARWARASALVRSLIAPVALAAPHDAASAERLVALGLPRAALGPAAPLKSAVALAPPDPSALAALGYDRAQTLLAASTHAGEEGPVLDAFLAARARRPALRLILAPRHPERGPEIARLIAARGVGLATRSAGAAPGDTPVYLADTLGEMALWYAAAGLCFVGGSLVAKGGHTPYEPAGFACAILHGPHVENAADAYAALAAAGAAVPVADTAGLADALATLDARDQERLGMRARETLAAQDIGPLADALHDRLGLGSAG